MPRRLNLLKWLKANTEIITAAATAGQLIVLIVGIAYTAKTLEEGNRVAWRTYLDTRASQMGLAVLDKEPLRCVTSHRIDAIDTRCAAVVYDPKNVTQVIEYVIQELNILDEAEDYAFSEDRSYYTDWYKGDANDLAIDPTGTVSFVLWGYFSCSTEKDCYSCNTGAKDDCGIGKRLALCIAGEDGKVDQKRCFQNLTAKRKKFMDAVALRADPARK